MGKTKVAVLGNNKRTAFLECRCVGFGERQRARHNKRAFVPKTFKKSGVRTRSKPRNQLLKPKNPRFCRMAPCSATLYLLAIHAEAKVEDRNTCLLSSPRTIKAGPCAVTSGLNAYKYTSNEAGVLSDRVLEPPEGFQKRYVSISDLALLPVGGGKTGNWQASSRAQSTKQRRRGFITVVKSPSSFYHP